MGDLISRQGVIDYVLEHGFYCDTEADKEYTAELIRTVFPSVDAVEVVRCKDCKHFDGECCDRYADETLGYSHSTQPNFFCACGERKTDV